ncbi:signal transduction histidine kinase [Clavibacter michiganensis]|uniref:sensor histidine kinase n=1 Tax=Clavibacter michiganensis TaxID=28447 RepID=UPI001AE191B0|nr:ATP-binding protein [Clavibacter michiganensis]MBP2457943.1 signal transduction histidine kinase [Clavibacter michiganensis]MDQ0410513.1 signal transduction histidine kinase [Clavibacter michiganensis]
MTPPALVARISADDRRRRGSTRAQIPFLLSCAVVVVIVAVVEPAVQRDAWYAAGIAMVLVGSVVALVVGASRIPSGVLIAVPALDLLAVAFIRDATAASLPAAALLVIFPLLWLVFGFPSGGVPVAVAGALAITVFPVLRDGGFPDTSVGWADLVGGLLLTALLVTAAGQAAATQRRDQRELAESTAAQARLLAESREQTATIRDVADAVDVGIVFFDADDRPVIRNAAVRTLLEIAGYDHETGLATSVYGSDRVTPVAREGKVLMEAIYADKVHGPVYWVGEPGNQRALVLSVRAIGRRPGQLTGTVLGAYDVTDLAQAVQVRDEFLATVSHELRTPLTSIVGYLDLLDELHDPAELGIQEEVAVIQRNVAQLSSIIGSLLEGADHAPALRRGPVDMTAVVDAVVRPAAERAAERGLVLEARLEPGVGLTGDADRLAQVVEALVSNALVFTPSGRIDVVLAREGADAVLSVVDTGVGLSEEDQQHVFDRFFRARSARDGAVPGIGLGLSIAERTVTAHGGSLRIASRLGHGTRVVATLPAEDGTTAP